MPLGINATRCVSTNVVVNSKELSSLFSLFDVNGDGFITSKELEQVFASMADILANDEMLLLDNLMQTNGLVSRDEFLEWAQKQPELGPYQLLRDIFKLIDTDGSGSLSSAEFSTLMSLFDAHEMTDAFQHLFDSLDVDKNGEINTVEFLSLLEQASPLNFSLLDLKLLKKKLVQISSSLTFDKISLLEVDCDLGAGKPGAGAGIEMLKEAIKKQHDLRSTCEQIMVDINDASSLARASKIKADTVTPHARHIEVITQVMKDAAMLVCNSLENDTFPLVLAGDHSTAASTIAGIRRAHPEKNLGVIWIDAHADIHSPFTTPSGNMHGMPLAIASGHDNQSEAINDIDSLTRQLWDELKGLHGLSSPAINLNHLIYVGVRDTEPAENVTLSQYDIPIVTTDDVRKDGPVAAANRCLSYLSDVDLIYVSFDVDCLDSTICKGTGTPVPGGLWVHEAILLLRTLLSDQRVCCWEICEINPHLDELNTLAEVSLGIFRAGIDVLSDRYSNC